MKYTFVPLVILKNSPCPWTRLTFIVLGSALATATVTRTVPLSSLDGDALLVLILSFLKLILHCFSIDFIN